MSGDVPEKIVSINLTTIELYRTVAAIIAAMATVSALVFGASYNFMMYTAERNFNLRITAAIHQGGAIDTAIQHGVMTGNYSLEKRLIRIETILLEMRDE